MLARFIIILIVAAGVLGGAAYFAYELFWKPKVEIAKEKEELAQQTPTPPPPHPGIAKFQAATAQLNEGKTAEGRQALAQLLEEHPDAPDAAEARRILGKINSEEFFSPMPGENKTPYTVVRGDALAKIASKTKSGAELIYMVNRLPNINLQIGQVLQIPSVDVAITINREAKTLTVKNHGRFFKEYPLVAATVPRLAADAKTEGTVTDKFVTLEGKRVAFGDKTYDQGERTILLSGGATLRSMPAEATEPPSGIVLAPADLREVYVVVSRGTPVSIE